MFGFLPNENTYAVDYGEYEGEKWAVVRIGSKKIAEYRGEDSAGKAFAHRAQLISQLEVSNTANTT